MRMEIASDTQTFTSNKTKTKTQLKLTKTIDSRSVYVFSPIRILLLRQIVFVIVFDIAIIHRDNWRCTPSSSLTRQSLSKWTNERTIRCDCGFYFIYIYTHNIRFILHAVCLFCSFCSLFLLVQLSQIFIYACRGIYVLSKWNTKKKWKWNIKKYIK